MTEFCPIIKENCKGNSCKFWVKENDENDCIILNYLIFNTGSLFLDKTEDDLKPLKINENNYTYLDFNSEERITKDFYDFIKLNYSNIKWISNNMLRFFFSKNGIEDYFRIKTEYKIKIENISNLTQDILNKEALEREKEIVYSLIDKLYNYTKENGLKQIRKIDVKSFLLDNSIELSTEAKEILYVKVNLLLKKN